MPIMKILNSDERETFEIPPVFSGVDRQKYFEFPLKIIRFIKSLRTPTNQVCFLVAFGYFKATKMFFSKKFHQKDIVFVARRFGIDPNQVKIESYEKPTYHRHKTIIREYFGFREFDEEARKIVIKEISSIIRSQLRAKLILIRITEILMSRKIEIPNYTILANLIIDKIKNHKQELVMIIENRLTPETRKMLDALLEKEDNQSSKIQRYKLTLLKKFHQSTRPKKIKANIDDLKTLKELFQSLEGLLKALNLTHEGIKYYAHSVIKSEIFQVSRRADEDRYLHLIAFVTHQYFKLQDLLIDTFLIAVQNSINISTREHKELYYEKRKEKNKSIKRVVDYLDKNVVVISTIRKIVNEPNLSDAEKIEGVQALLVEYERQHSEIKENISHFKEESEKVLKDADFYSIVETKSVKLQNRASDIVKDIEFDADTSSKILMAAIEYYKKKDGAIDKKAPADFL